MEQQIEDPEVAFSAWTPWHERSTLRVENLEPTMGVYMWARFQVTPTSSSGRYPDLPSELIYVGETNNLNARPLGSSRHHRVDNYIELFPDDSDLAKLYVAICKIAPFRERDEACHAWRACTRHLESKIAWEYTKRFGRRPLLDYKRGKDEFALPLEMRPNALKPKA